MRVDFMKTIDDFKHFNVIGAVQDFGDLILELPYAFQACTGMDDDIAAIMDWATIFKDPLRLMKTVSMNYLKHGVDIQHDIAQMNTDWHAGSWFNAGHDLADALVLLNGPIHPDALHHGSHHRPWGYHGYYGDHGDWNPHHGYYGDHSGYYHDGGYAPHHEGTFDSFWMHDGTHHGDSYYAGDYYHGDHGYNHHYPTEHHDAGALLHPDMHLGHMSPAHGDHGHSTEAVHHGDTPVEAHHPGYQGDFHSDVTHGDWNIHHDSYRGHGDSHSTHHDAYNYHFMQ
jgi:hypothetical protein